MGEGGDGIGRSGPKTDLPERHELPLRPSSSVLPVDTLSSRDEGSAPAVSTALPCPRQQRRQFKKLRSSPQTVNAFQLQNYRGASPEEPRPAHKVQKPQRAHAATPKGLLRNVKYIRPGFYPSNLRTADKVREKRKEKGRRWSGRGKKKERKPVCCSVTTRKSNG